MIPRISILIPRISHIPTPIPTLIPRIPIIPRIPHIPSPQSPYSHPNSPYSHRDSSHSLYFSHSIPRFPILAFTDSRIWQTLKNTNEPFDLFWME